MTGVGSSGNPYIISTHQGLEQLRCFNGADFKIAPATAIDLTGIEWLPVLTFDSTALTNRNANLNFASSLDGQNSEIQNLNINTTGKLYDGIANYGTGVAFIGDNFHSGADRPIKNLIFRDPISIGTGGAGTVIALGNYTIDNVHVINGTVQGAGYTGGIASQILSYSASVPGRVINSSFEGTITYVNGGGATGLGGLVGRASLGGAILDDNTFNGTIQLGGSPSNRNEVGGIVGKYEMVGGTATTTLPPSVSRNSVLGSSLTGTNTVGGVIGVIAFNATVGGTPSSFVIENNYVDATLITATNQTAAGILARVSTAGNLTGKAIYIRKNAVRDATVQAANTVGGIVAWLGLGEISDSYFVDGFLGTGALSRFMGGILGFADPGTNTTLRINSSYASTSTTIPTGGYSNYGGLVGSGISSVTFTTASYWDGQSTGLAVACSGTATGLDANDRTTAEMQGGQTGTVFVGWNTATIWTFPGAAYPKLQAPNPN
jgi:hypothetical protein